MMLSRYQSFDDDNDGKSDSAGRLAAMRRELAGHGLDGFIVPRADRHQGEYVAPSDERLAWLTGFTGSAGLAIVLTDSAAIFVDGRYTLAVRDQIDIALVEPVSVAEQTPEQWLLQHAMGQKIGYDPWLATPGQVERLTRAMRQAGGTLVAVDSNPVDAAWGATRPANPASAITLRSPRLAGESTAKKIARVREGLGKADALFVSDPHAVAWLFNLRGSDLGHTPLALAFALVGKEALSTLFLAADRVPTRFAKQLAKSVELADPSKLDDTLAELASAGRTVMFDAATVPSRLTRLFEDRGGTALVGADPIALMKACKNAAELAGSREAHLRDGAAVVRFLHWFDEHARPDAMTEIEAALALEAFREETGLLKDLSFPTISAAGPHSAIPHYRVSTQTDRRLSKGIYLVDSGAQYEDGTTDVTRTLAVGRPSALMRERYTRVLKGHVALSRARFPKGTTGAQLDALARLPLWQAGLDFDHGTGHGVGAYLSVHEGPQRLAKTGHVPLQPGMILSNEPGYYKADAFGIRIENLVVVAECEIAGGERPMLAFETITLAPYDRRLIDGRLLDGDERTWIDAYHARVRREIGPLVPADARRWLAEATRRLS